MWRDMFRQNQAELIASAECQHSAASGHSHAETKGFAAAAQSQAARGASSSVARGSCSPVNVRWRSAGLLLVLLSCGDRFDAVRSLHACDAEAQARRRRRRRGKKRRRPWGGEARSSHRRLARSGHCPCGAASVFEYESGSSPSESPIRLTHEEPYVIAQNQKCIWSEWR